MWTCHQITPQSIKWPFALKQAVVNKPYTQEGCSCTVEMCSIGTRTGKALHMHTWQGYRRQSNCTASWIIVTLLARKLIGWPFL